MDARKLMRVTPAVASALCWLQWLIMCVAKPDCATRLTRPRYLSQDLLLSFSPISVILYLPALGMCTLKLSCFGFLEVYGKCLFR